jgi:hypothetical protein
MAVSRRALQRTVGQERDGAQIGAKTLNARKQRVRGRYKGVVRGKSSGERGAEDLSFAHIGKRQSICVDQQ